MKPNKDYTKEPYSFLVNDTTLSSDNPLRIRKNLFKMIISKKIKAINNKIEENKAHYNLDKQTATISALSSGNISKYELLTDKDVLPEKYLLEKATTMKRFEYSSLGKELNAQTDIAKKQYQKLDDTDEFVRTKK